MKSSQNTIKIIFNIDGRTEYVTRYLNLICNNYNQKICFDLLIINEKKNKFINKKFKNLNIINTFAKKKICGMNDIFREIYNSQIILKKYKYCCFVEDDNFIFPKSLLESEVFLDNNSSFIACSGQSFIFSKKNKQNYYYVNKYTSPNKNLFNNIYQRFKNYNGALCYYSLFRIKFFLKILKLITQINDDNMSEVFFNYMTIKFGKINQLNNIYLARQYPRPKIYNIPDRTTWISNENLLTDIHFIIKTIDPNNSSELLENSIYKYISKRLYDKNKKINFKDKVLYLINKFKFYFFNYKIIKNFINNLHKL